MPQSEFIELKDWLKLNDIELDVTNDKVKCVNMPDDWHDGEDLEKEDEEE